MAEQFFEMWWDCDQCNTRGLLGSQHRHCPTCGAAQDPARRYFPPPGAEVEAKGHRFVGVDWLCAYCESPNASAAAHCGNCGAPKDGAREVVRVQDATPEQAPVSQRPAADTSRQKPSGWPWMKALLALLVVVVSVLGYQFFHLHGESVQVVDMKWQRQIDVERFTSVQTSTWCDQLPATAYDVTRTREQRSTRQVEAGQECHDVRTDMGDGTFTKRQECVPRYRDEPVYDLRCHYRINQWRVLRTDQASGGPRQPPVWPTAHLTQAWSGTDRLGVERLGPRRETYQVTMQSAKGKRWTCPMPPEPWSALEEGQQLTLQVRGTGGADCDSLLSRQ